ncbi:hypothetical protein TNCV_4192651 [Trichonephila clavipes]|nr:hypothetical protein TNCV_4192651 [Trichonephila clavipes]
MNGKSYCRESAGSRYNKVDMGSTKYFLTATARDKFGADLENPGLNFWATEDTLWRQLNIKAVWALIFETSLSVEIFIPFKWKFEAHCSFNAVQNVARILGRGFRATPHGPIANQTCSIWLWSGDQPLPTAFSELFPAQDKYLGCGPCVVSHCHPVTRKPHQ